MAVRQTELLCHELLLKLAGRLPDRHLWRYRDWLAGEAAGVVARVLPSTLVSERITITDDEHQLMSDALLPLGGDPAVINAVLPSDGTVTNYKVSAESPVDSRGDTEARCSAPPRNRPGVREFAQLAPRVVMASRDGSCWCGFRGFVALTGNPAGAARTR